MNKGLVVALVLVVSAALGSLFVPHQFLSPGPLISGHTKLDQDCLACHKPFEGPGKCETCHKPEDFLKKPVAKAEFHHKLSPQSCTSCHTDHGVRHVSHFSHNLLDAKTNQDCSGCHKAPADKIHLGVKENCSACHGQGAFKPAAFEHGKWFQFDKNHKAKCITCHQAEDYTTYTCFGCHAHGLGEIRGEHAEEGVLDLRDCAGCHPSGKEYDTNMHRRRPVKDNGIQGPIRQYDRAEALAGMSSLPGSTGAGAESAPSQGAQDFGGGSDHEGRGEHDSKHSSGHGDDDEEEDDD